MHVRARKPTNQFRSRDLVHEKELSVVTNALPVPRKRKTDSGISLVLWGVVWCGVVWCGVVWCGVINCTVHNDNLR